MSKKILTSVFFLGSLSRFSTSTNDT